MRIEPYLFFDGRSEEAMSFYEKALGAERETLMRFSDCPDPMPQDCLPAGESEARQAFDNLAGSGRVIMPLGPTFFSPCYGLLADQFGVQWMIRVSPPNP